MRRVLLTALAIFGLLAASAEAQQTGTQGIHSWPSPTIPLPVGSCMYVQQPVGGGTYTDTALCPSTLAGWATALGITATLPTLAGATANTAHVLGNGTATSAAAADTIFTAGSGVTITCATGTCTIGASGTGGVSGPGTSVIGNLVGWASATGDALSDLGIAGSNVATKSGTNTFAGANTFASTVTLSGITGSTQCLQVNTSGVVSGTGAACGGGGGGTLTVNGTTGTVSGVTGLTITGAAGTTVAVTGSTPNATATITAAAGGGISGMTAGQVPIANSATTINASKALANPAATTIATASGTLTNGHCVSIDASGNFVDAGGACTTGGGGGTVNAGTAGQTAYYATSTNAVSGSSGISLSGTKLTAASIGLGSDATGDIYYNGGSGALTRLPIGGTGTVLTVAAGLPSWAAAAGGGNVSTAGTLTANTLIIGAGTTNIGNEADWSVASHNLIMNTSGATAPAFPSGTANGIQLVAPASGGAWYVGNSWTFPTAVIGRRAEGTPSSPTAATGSELALIAQGYNGTTYAATGAEIALAPSTTLSSTVNGHDISFFVTSNTPSASLTRAMVLSNSGCLELANSGGTLPGDCGAGGVAVPTAGGYFVGTSQVGATTYGATTAPITVAQWDACQGIVVTTGGQTFTLAAANTLSVNGCYDITAQAATTLALASGTDTINGGSAGASLSIPAGTATTVKTNGSNAFSAPLGGASAGVASLNTSTPGVVVAGTGSGPYTGAVTVDLTAASNTQSGNSAYTIVAGDKNKTVYRTNTTTETDILPATGTSGFGVGYGMDYCVDGTGNTISVSTSTINGQASLFVPPYTCLAIQATATNVYLAARSSPRVAPLANITATGNVDMAQACFIPLNYNSASAGTLTFPDVAGFAGCITSISELSTGQATVAAAGSATVVANSTACATNKRTAGQYATITVQVLEDASSHPVYKVAGECG